MSQTSDAEVQQRGRLAERVMSSSTGMVGACATLVGLAKLSEPRQGLTLVDEGSALMAVAFVVSALLAYLALRSSKRPVLQSRLEGAADFIFLGAMIILAAIGVTFAFDLL